jgi:ankyrin repeat protein
MRIATVLLFALFLSACGKHDSTSYGFSNTSDNKQGDKADSPEEFMVLAILNDDKQLFLETLDTLPDINFRLSEQRTFLIEAARNKRALFVHHLLQKGADRTAVDSFQKTAFDYSVENNSVKIQFLLDENQFPKIQAELWAAVTALASANKVMDAIEAGADPNVLNEQGETVLTFLIKNINYANKKNKAPMIIKEVLEWKDELFGLTKTNVSTANAGGETPLSLLEVAKKNSANADDVKKLDLLIKKIQKALAEEAP